MSEMLFTTDPLIPEGNVCAWSRDSLCVFATYLNVCVVSLLYVMEFGCLIVADF